jgi:hypothetical protein
VPIADEEASHGVRHRVDQLGVTGLVADPDQVGLPVRSRDLDRPTEPLHRPVEWQDLQRDLVLLQRLRLQPEPDAGQGDHGARGQHVASALVRHAEPALGADQPVLGGWGGPGHLDVGQEPFPRQALRARNRQL